eukprot:CAMPEP_0198229008 /NCGR_PEP_ID=MMETSP1445-20131203/113897_1 /TAXON_ID=36898 /ORGANISM="Pyramimonas sp., Strain CCMP2087" /LENGTH=118 /DNA_ID=CAMNT_0043909445 /DNA_START=125 /DNA_END=481 /DNA_ORIENTATION=-
MGTKRKPTSDRTEQCALMHANKKLQNQTARLSAGQSDTIATPAAPAAVAAPPPHIVREVRSLVPNQLIEGVDMPSLGKNASKNAVLARAEELFIDTNPGHSRCSPQRRVGEPTWPRLL